MQTPEYSSKRSRQVSRLIEINHLLAKLQPQIFLQSLVEIAAEFTLSEYCSILVIDSDENVLRFSAGPYLHMPKLRELKVPLEGSIAGATYTEKKTYSFPNPDESPRIFQSVQEILGITTQTLLSVPICFQDKVLGVLQAVNRYEGNYDHEDAAFLESFAALAGTTLWLDNLEKKADQMREEFKLFESRKDDFVAITSHELRTPLGVILGNATFLREMLPNPDLRPQVEAIVIGALRLKDLIESLTQADNLQTGTASLRVHHVNINQLVEDLVTSYQSEAQRKKIKLNMMLEKDELIIEGEADKIGIALQNIVRNALSFTDEQGMIQISTRKLPGYAQVTVTDTGIGIPENELDQIFERFYQIESHMTRRHGGMGLGLSVAKSMIEMHGGQIWVKSKPGDGSTFTFVLPDELGNQSKNFEP